MLLNYQNGRNEVHFIENHLESSIIPPIDKQLHLLTLYFNLPIGPVTVRLIVSLCLFMRWNDMQLSDDDAQQMPSELPDVANSCSSDTITSLVGMGDGFDELNGIIDTLDHPHTPSATGHTSINGKPQSAVFTCLIVALFSDGFVCRHLTRKRGWVEGFAQSYDTGTRYAV